MARVSMSIDLQTSADEVWRLIGGFNALPDWHSAIVKSDLEEGGSIRLLEIQGGATIRERLISHDNAERIYRYTITESPLPIEDYQATLQVRDGEGGGCQVEWSGEFQPSGASEDEADGIVRGIYQAGFDAFAERFGG
jgi:hypothetical protein